MIKKKVLPPPDIYASCPSEGLILEYYQSHFDSVFIAFHQFYKTNESLEAETKTNECQLRADSRRTHVAVPWQDIVSKLSLSSVADIDVGLRTSIGGLNTQFENKRLAEQLEQLAADQSICLPSEGRICPFVEEMLLSTLMDLGYEWLWVGDEFATERQLHWLEDIVEKEALPYSACCYTPDKQLLIATHWDSHCTFICANKTLLKAVIDGSGVEGVYCNERTEVYWGLSN